VIRRILTIQWEIPMREPMIQLEQVYLCSVTLPRLLI
jgi:hypothetical protein